MNANVLSAVRNTRTKLMIIRQIFENLSRTLAAPFRRRFSSYPVLPHPPKPRPLSPPLRQQSRNRRHSIMLSPALPWPAAKFSSNITLVQVRTPYQVLWRSTPSQRNVLAKLGSPKMPKSKADFWQDGIPLLTPT